jgi:hypothetical protein
MLESCSRHWSVLISSLTCTAVPAINNTTGPRLLRLLAAGHMKQAQYGHRRWDMKGSLKQDSQWRNSHESWAVSNIATVLLLPTKFTQLLAAECQQRRPALLFYPHFQHESFADRCRHTLCLSASMYSCPDGDDSLQHGRGTVQSRFQAINKHFCSRHMFTPTLHRREPLARSHHGSRAQDHC